MFPRKAQRDAMRHWTCLCGLILTALLVSSCGVREPMRRYSGPLHPPVSTTSVTFQASQIPAGCRVLAHVVQTSPAGATAQEIASTLTTEAAARGADLLLVGLSREVKKGSPPAISYHGPELPYRFADGWTGWKFGLDEWLEQGGWATLGAAEWGSPSVRFDRSIRTKVAFLRCQ